MTTLAPLLGLTDEEGRKAVPAALFQVAFVGAVALLKSVAAALVVSRASSASLPALYIASAFATALAAGVVPQEGRAPGREMALWGAAILALAGASALGSVLGVLGLYLAGDAFATLNQVRFWARAGELFDVRASRRLFAAFAAASMVGSVLGGGLAQSLARSFGPVPLAALAGVLACGCAPLGIWMDSKGPRKSRGQRAPALPWKVLGHDVLVQRVAVFVGLASVLTVCVDFLFRARAGEVMDERQLASLFGAINVWVGLIAAAFQLVLARPLLDRLGLFHYLGMVPAICAVLAGMSLLFHGLWPVVALKVAEAAGSLSLTPLAVQLLYGPMPDDRRSSARAAIDGLVKKGGLGLGGLALLLAGARVGPLIPALALAVGALLVALLSRLQRVYVNELSARLARAHWDAEIALDAQGRKVLRDALRSPSAGVVLTSLTLLQEVPEELPADALAPLLGHASERVQLRALELAGALGRTELVAPVRSLMHSDKRRVRGQAVRALAQLAAGELASEVEPLLQHEDPGTRGAAIAALWFHPPSRAAAQAALEVMSRPEASDAERRELAFALGSLDAGSAFAHLKRLVDDPEPSVRHLAYASVAKLELVELAPQLLARLGPRGDRVAARMALASLGDAVLPLLEKALNDRDLPLPVRLELPRVLREVGTSAAANALLHSNIDDLALLRHRIGLALSGMRRANPRLALDTDWVKDAIGRRLDAYAHYAPALADLRAALPEKSLLVRAIADRLDQSLEVAFRLVALLAPHDPAMDAHHRLRRGGPSERAFAAELVENVLPDARLRRRMALLIDAYHRHATPGSAERAPERIRELCSSKDPVLAGVARHAAVSLGVKVEASEDAMSEQVVETMFLLEGVELFAGSGVDDLAALAAIARELRVPAGAPVFKKGDPGDRLFIILSGEVRIVSEGHEHFRLGSKDSFGEVSLLDGAPRPADALAANDLHLLAISRQEFLDLVADRPELLQGVLAQLAYHLRLLLEGPGGAKVSLKRPVSAEQRRAG
ncbi:MAG: cyclic nucleotide-binding domain-containing protein [Deltaproteobacteria bacterium]|nr:cyclic nucleotide-binding domain-containing protein [Deltaproteobacteria bacterium]